MAILTIQGVWPTHHGDTTQLVNSRYCVGILCILALAHTVMVTLYYKEPIQCFCPPNFSKEYCDATKSYCVSHLTQSTYQVIVDTIPIYHDEGPERIAIPFYYQFAPLIFLFQASLFYVPCIIMREIMKLCGVIPEEMALQALDARRNKDTKERQSAVADLARHMQLFCSRQFHKRHMSLAFRWFHGNKVTLGLMFSKCLYIANAIGQFYMLNSFLGKPFDKFGWQILGRILLPFPSLSSIVDYFVLFGYNESDLPADITLDDLKNMSGMDIPSIDEFPEETNLDKGILTFDSTVMCDYQIRNLERINRYSVQCFLSLNGLNEVTFKYVWFVLFTATSVTAVYLIASVIHFATFACHSMAIRERLMDTNSLCKPDPRDTENVEKVTNFETQFLHRDGLLLLSYIEAGAGDVVADEVLQLLWQYYQDKSEDMLILAKPVKWEKPIIIEEKKFPQRDETTDAEAVPLTDIRTPSPEVTPQMDDSLAAGHDDPPPRFEDVVPPIPESKDNTDPEC